MKENTNEEEVQEELECKDEQLEYINLIIIHLIEKTIPEQPKPLTLEKAGKCLKVLGKIWNLSEYPPTDFIESLKCEGLGEKLMDMEGYVDEYQYLKIEAVDMALTDIKVIPKNFIWLLSADLSGNRLNNETACPVTKLLNLVALKLNRNRIEDPYLPPMKHLQYLGLNSNRITSLHRIYHPNLETLDLNNNLISRIYPEDCWKLTKLRQLELRGNKLKSTFGIEYTSLVNLYLAQNQITNLTGLEILVNLERLHLRDNPLSDLSDFTSSNINLKYLNLRNCQINTVEDLQNLSVLKNLQVLIIKGNSFNPDTKSKAQLSEEEDEEDEDDEDDENENPLQEEDNEDLTEEENTSLRIKILFYIPTLVRIDKSLVTKEEKRNARNFTEEPT